MFNTLDGLQSVTTKFDSFQFNKPGKHLPYLIIYLYRMTKITLVSVFELSIFIVNYQTSCHIINLSCHLTFLHAKDLPDV